MAKPFRLEAKTQLLAHDGQLYTVAEVLPADWENLPGGAFIFLSKSVRGSSHYSERDKAILCPVLPGVACAVRIVRNELAAEGPLVVAPHKRSKNEPAEAGHIKRNIYRLYYPLSAEPLPTL